MRRIAIFIPLLLITGCATTRPPRWEVSFTLNLEQKLDSNTQVKGAIGFKRPSAPYPVEKKP